MNVERNYCASVKFEVVMPGEGFMKGDDSYIRLKEAAGKIQSGGNAVNLTTGELYYFADDAPCKKIGMKVVVG